MTTTLPPPTRPTLPPLHEKVLAALESLPASDTGHSPHAIQQATPPFEESGHRPFLSSIIIVLSDLQERGLIQEVTPPFNSEWVAHWSLSPTVQ